MEPLFMKIIERKVYPIEIMNVGNRFLLQTYGPEWNNKRYKG